MYKAVTPADNSSQGIEPKPVARTVDQAVSETVRSLARQFAKATHIWVIAGESPNAPVLSGVCSSEEEWTQKVHEISERPLADDQKLYCFTPETLDDQLKAGLENIQAFAL